MNDPLQCIAALLPTLSHAELRVLIVLTATEHRSTRAIAAAAGLARSNAKAALHSLAERNLIHSDGGTATRAARVNLSYLTVTELNPSVPMGPGSKTDPPPGLTAGPPLGLFQAHPGPVLSPPPGSATDPHPRARVDVASDFDSTIDRLLKAKSAKIEDELLRTARSWLHGYQRKFGREPQAHPPDDQITAQFLAVAEWPRLERMLYDLIAERQPPGTSYAWFVSVAMQRIHGISPQQLQRRRAELRAVKRPKPLAPEQQPLQPSESEMDPDPVVQEALALQRELRAMAAAKGMR